MENSKTSMSCKSICPKAKPEDCSDNEESTWTFYLEDYFLRDNKKEHNGYDLSSGYGSPNSLVSDAASSVGKKSADKNGEKSLSFKKRKKTKWALVDFDGHDHALQDTASSPANGPKEKGNSISGGQTNERSTHRAVHGPDPTRPPNPTRPPT
ncbi:vascular-related unknown protein 4-like isoform X2 [Rhododendron vialii]|uniref:vascular-related unknown protein 4-like isoform X2 n=1 Tax=Rhododendron vialii TaxID=182163 RepID=UPI00266039D8|nr:vascular-related unknown protein 4-like isoform X2 [Rhododendron vialii]